MTRRVIERKQLGALAKIGLGGQGVVFRAHARTVEVSDQPPGVIVVAADLNWSGRPT